MGEDYKRIKVRRISFYIIHKQRVIFIYCVKCGKNLPENSKFCNDCGSLQEKSDVNTQIESQTSEPTKTHHITKHRKKENKNKKNGCSAVILVLILFIVVICWLPTMDEKTTDESTYSVTESTTKEIIQISASKLIKAYQENEINASNNYKDKYLEVTGYVEQISRSDNLFMDDGYYVYINYGNDYDFNTICCSLNDESVEAASKFTPGDKITIIGRCEGFSTIYVNLYDCIIVK